MNALMKGEEWHMDGETWVRAKGIEEFRDTTVPLLSARPAENIQLLAVFDRLLREGPHAFGEHDPELLTWHGSQGTAALLRTPPYPYILSGDPDEESISALVEILLDSADSHDGREINVPAACEPALVEAWTERGGHRPRVVERLRLYRLEAPLDPDPSPPGRAKLADPGDVPAVARFLQEFWAAIERDQPLDATMTAQRIAAARIAEGVFWLWMDEADEPVSVAGTTPIIAGTGRIGPVFTPAPLRGRGYAGAVTTAAGRALLDHGADQVLLFTDLANATSNALYQRVGYRPVSDRMRIALEG